ncbi:MAG: helix-turn-helix domain-containing protein [Opitutales bacterium]|jgi:ribosome-binding protein aMBF1 (putative translation factor)
MKKIKSNPRIGSSFDEWLEAEGIREEVEERSARRALAIQLARAMEKRGVSQMELARRMGTSRAVVQRVLDASNPSLTFKTAQKATMALGLYLVLRLEEGAEAKMREREWAVS